MIRQGCCWTGYSELSYSNHVRLLFPPSFFLSFSPSFPYFFFLSFPFFKNFSFPSSQASVREMDAFTTLVPELSRWTWRQQRFSSPSQALFPCWLGFHQAFLKRQWTMLVTLSIAHLFSVFKKKKTQPKKQQLCAPAAQQLPSADLGAWQTLMSSGSQCPCHLHFTAGQHWGVGRLKDLPGHTQCLNSTLAWVDFLVLWPPQVDSGLASPCSFTFWLSFCRSSLGDSGPGRTF